MIVSSASCCDPQSRSTSAPGVLLWQLTVGYILDNYHHTFSSFCSTRIRTSQDRFISCRSIEGKTFGSRIWLIDIVDRIANSTARLWRFQWRHIKHHVIDGEYRAEGRAVT